MENISAAVVLITIIHAYGLTFFSEDSPMLELSANAIFYSVTKSWADIVSVCATNVYPVSFTRYVS